MLFAKRAKYCVVGAAVNLVTRIESFTDGGQILCSEDTFREAGGGNRFEKGLAIETKGTGTLVPTFFVRGPLARAKKISTAEPSRVSPQRAFGDEFL
jgi:class 3 adenylate cyclase